MRNLVWAWGALLVLSAATTLVALSPIAAPIAGTLILFAAWAKARLIFLWYLELYDVPGWRGGVQFGLCLFVLGLWTLFLLT